jgi:hypothetical protein
MAKLDCTGRQDNGALEMLPSRCSDLTLVLGPQECAASISKQWTSIRDFNVMSICSEDPKIQESFQFTDLTGQL